MNRKVDHTVFIARLPHFFLLILLALLMGCGGQNPQDERFQSLKPAEGGVFYGGIFRQNEVEYFRSLYPLNITEVGGHRIANQIYQGLVRLNQADLSIEPCLAYRWEIDSTATKYTFYLRKGVLFHDDPCFPDGKGREVTAHDFKYCFQRLCTPAADNQGFWVFENKVKGATEYFNARKEGLEQPGDLEGVKVIDDYTLLIELEKPFASFLHILAMPFTAVFPREAVEKYGLDMRVHPVGTGPFRLQAIKEDEVVVLTRNPGYWEKDQFGNQLPYLDGVKFSFIKERVNELYEFEKGNLDMIYQLPLELQDQIVDREDNLIGKYKKYQLQVQPSLTVQYYGFQHKDPVFANRDVRKAFNYAVDREKIVNYTLKGGGIPAIHGIVPPGLPGYDTKAINGYEYDADKARAHLEAAGYPGGKGFPEITLQINSGGGRNEQVAEAVKKMLEDVLNIKINLTKLPFAQHLENLETGKAKFWRSGWIADYPDPENFLNLLYGKHVPEKLEEKSYLNSVRYQNAVYDSLFELALKTIDDDKRNLLYMRCDQIAMDDAAILPLYYNKDYRLLQPYVRNFPKNPMEYRTYHNVYFVKDMDISEKSD